MFIRSKVVKGRTYYQVIEAYREDGQPRQRTLASLGTHPTIEGARSDAVERYFAPDGKVLTRNVVVGEYIAYAGEKVCKAVWLEVNKLDDLARRWHAEKGTVYQEDPRIEAEKARFKAEWEKRRRRAEREEPRRRARRARREAENEQWWRDFYERHKEAREREEARERIYYDLVTLGLVPTEEAVQEAYRRKSRECHPDHGGSEQAMTRVNLAHDRLLDLVRNPPPTSQESPDDADPSTEGASGLPGSRK
jgi:hypothetical protein